MDGIRFDIEGLPFSSPSPAPCKTHTMHSQSAQAAHVSASPDGVACQEGPFGSNVALLITIGLLWLQLYYSVIPVWIHGDYYDYAWFVPPIAAFFFSQRWKQRPRGKCSPFGGMGLIIAAGILFPVLLSIRALEGVDPSWRPPMILHAGFVVLLTHWLVWRHGSRSATLGMIPVTLFALSAIPYPYQLESALIQGLTGWVVHSAGGLFQLMGRSVEVSGGILTFEGTQVSVTDGCSGIQSLQSLVMVALCFGEFFRLRIGQRFLLVGLAVVVALTVNVGRALYLARIRFDEGESSFESAHDGVGHAAFAIGGLCLLLITRSLIAMGGRKRKTLRRSQVKPS
jgi:exosortase